MVPDGTYLQLPKATTVGEELAQEAAMQGTYSVGEYDFIGPGMAAPNLVLYPPTADMFTRMSSTVVTRATYLSDMLMENMGVCVWAACK
jgi:hypothetical protein